MSGDVLCRNCGFPITWVNYALAPRWMHQHPGAAFEDGIYEYCKGAVATPPEGVQP